MPSLSCNTLEKLPENSSIFCFFPAILFHKNTPFFHYYIIAKDSFTMGWGTVGVEITKNKMLQKK